MYAVSARAIGKSNPNKSQLESLAFRKMIVSGIPEPLPQYGFDTTRPRRKADFAWPRIKLLLEIDGGTWSVGGKKCKVCGQSQKGGHNSGAGYERDRIRDAEAVMLGWRVIRVTGAMVRDGRMVDIVRRAITAFKVLDGV
jgi:hypothetical protein